MNSNRWKPGESGNPKGRQQGTRNRVTEAFLRDLEELWRKNGPAVLDLAATTEPMQFAQMVAKLLPKDFQVTHNAGESFIEALKFLNGSMGQSLDAEQEQSADLRDGGVAGHA